jgi:hypothetical protein
VLACLAGAAQAAPIANATAAFEAGTGSPSAVEKAQVRRCWWEDGYRTCRWYGPPRVYGWFYDDEPVYGWRRRGPDDYPAGSRRWWDEMEREDRAGTGGR